MAWRARRSLWALAAAMIFVFAVSGRSQNTAWVAECGSSSIVTSNGGTPTLDNIERATQSQRVREDRLYDMSYQMVDDGANGSIIVFESRRRNVEEPAIPDNAFQIIPDSRHMYLRHINASGATVDEVQLDDGTETISLPHIIKRLDGGYIVTYRESGSSGDNIVANWYTLDGAGYLMQGIGPVAMVTSDFSYGIGEYSICRDSENGVVIAAAVSIHAPWTQTDNICNITWQESPDSAIYAQWIGGDGTRLWGNSARLISDPTWTGNAKVVFNPIASIETRSNHLVDIAWGQEVDTRSSGGCYCSYIFVQRFDITLMYTYDQQYPNGGVYLPLTGDPFGMDHAAPQHNDPFYMTYCYSLATASPLDVFVWRHGTASDVDAGRVMVEAYTFGSPLPSQVWPTPYEVPNTTTTTTDRSQPSGIVPYTTQRGNWYEDDPVIVYMRDDGTTWYDNDGVTCTGGNHPASKRANHTANVFRLYIKTGANIYDKDIHTGIGSQRFVAQMAETQNGMVSDKVFAVIPDWDSDYVCKIDPSNSIVPPTVLTVPHRCSPYKNTAQASRGDCYEAISLGTSQINVVNFEYGLPQIEQQVLGEYTANYGLGNNGMGYIYDADRANYTTADDYSTNPYMTKPYSGHFYGQNAKLLFQSYPTAGAFAAQLAMPALLEGSGLQHSVHSTNVADTNAIVYEQWYDNGSSDIELAYSLNAGQAWQHLVITNALTTGYTYVTPKVAIYNGSGTLYAIITYNRESVLSGTSYSGMYSAAVNLTTGTVSSYNNLIESVANYSVDMRNFDLVVDPISEMLYAVYGHGFAGGGPGSDQIECEQLMSNGAPYPYPTWVDTASRDKIMQVSACFDPDPANSGVYIVWRDHSPLGPSKVGLNHISNVGLRWRAGIQYHISLNDCYQPCVAAAPKWVMMAWSDEEQTFNPYSSPLVFACAWDDTGAVLPGWTIANGIQVSTAAGQYTGTYYEAFDPAIVVTNRDSINGACVIAFSQDEDPSWSNFSVSSPRSIGTRSVAINGTLGMQGDLAFNAAPNPRTELTQSFFGYMERKPKLSIIGGHDPYTDIFQPWTNWVLCAFQTMPYHYSAKPYEALELANYYEEQPVYAQSNISALVLSPDGHTREMGFNIANGPNAQELEALHWSADEGFWGCFLNYDNSDNHTPDIAVVNIRAFAQTVLDQGGAAWTVPDSTWSYIYPCHSPNPGRAYYDTHSVPLHNTSHMYLPISAILFGVYPPPGDNYPPAPTDFSSDLGTAIPPVQSGGFAQNNITYRPTIFHEPCDPVVPFQEQVFADPMGGPPYLDFLIINCNAQKATTRPTSALTDLVMVATPNPSTGEFELHVQGLDGAPYDIEVINLLGQVVYHASHSESQNGPLAESLDLSALPSGQYIIRLSSVGRILNSMVVLQK